MTFLFDHDVPDEIAHFLRHLGHEVHLLRAALPRETIDADVLAHAADHGWVLVTCNRDDFLVLAAKQTHAGIIVLIRRRTRVAERAALMRLIHQAGRDGLAGNINFA